MEYFEDLKWIEEKYGQKYCNSGGAEGADTIFEQECASNGIPTIAWSFLKHKTKSSHKKNLTENELNEGFEHVKIANKSLKRSIFLQPYVKNLLSRNWFQVKYSDAIFAVANLDGKNKVSGGTGWCCAMAIDNKKPVYVFDMNYKKWFIYDYDISEFKEYDGIPKLTDKFAGVGSREINEFGINAIKQLFQKNI